MNLFTYGSLMFPDVWQRVAGESFPTQPATLHDFAAWKVRGETYPGLAPGPGEETAGVVYFNVSPEAAARLDAFEGPFYERTEVQVRLADGTCESACAYVVAASHHDELAADRWDADEFRRHHLAHFFGPKPVG